MLISLDWLKMYVDIEENINDLEHALTMIGQEVEAIEEQGEGLNSVVVGKVVELGQHPEADKLTLCKVNVGEEELQIVCGATNHKLGDKVAVAKVGAVLGGNFKIKKSKIRGVESFGMMCSGKELGISEENDGILILDSEAIVGMNLKEYMELNDVVFELEITPNRPDCLSHIGIAREVAAYYDRDVKYPEINLVESSEKIDGKIEVEIEDRELCKRYASRIIKGVEIKESPAWLVKRLASVGIRSINNIVDVTNFILMETGHPMHAFDYSKIDGNKIVVRKAKKDEKITTLDGVERELKEGILVIADENKVVAVAGIMGGANSEVSKETTDILLEVAYFTPENIRRTSKEMILSSDSAYRFERGIDIEDTEYVIDRAAELIKSIAGGDVLCGKVDVKVENSVQNSILFNICRLNKFLGKDIPEERVVKIFENLEFGVEKLDVEEFKITPPFYRGDIERAADLYEEVLRMYGFDNIEAKMPEENIESGKVDENMANVEKYKSYLVEMGLQEVINYSFIPENATTNLNMGEVETVKLINPINEDMVVMRPTLIHSLVVNMRDNFNKNIFDLKLFEVSRVFEKTENPQPNEVVKIGIAIGGRERKNLWDAKPENYDFYDIKAYVEKTLELSGISSYKLDRTNNLTFHPGRGADIFIGRDIIGSFGELHPDVAESYSLKEKAYVAELDMAKILKYVKKKNSYKRIAKYPAVNRDLAFVLSEDKLVGNMVSDIAKQSPLIESVELFDVYKGERLEAGLQSAAVNILMRSDKGTLNDEDVNKVMDKIFKVVEKNYGGKLRA